MIETNVFEIKKRLICLLDTAESSFPASEEEIMKAEEEVWSILDNLGYVMNEKFEEDDINSLMEMAKVLKNIHYKRLLQGYRKTIKKYRQTCKFYIEQIMEDFKEEIEG